MPHIFINYGEAQDNGRLQPEFLLQSPGGCKKLGVSCALYMHYALGPRHTVNKLKSKQGGAPPITYSIMDNVINNMACRLKSAGVLNFALSQEQCPISL